MKIIEKYFQTYIYTCKTKDNTNSEYTERKHN